MENVPVQLPSALTMIWVGTVDSDCPLYVSRRVTICPTLELKLYPFMVMTSPTDP